MDACTICIPAFTQALRGATPYKRVSESVFARKRWEDAVLGEREGQLNGWICHEERFHVTV